MSITKINEKLHAFEEKLQHVGCSVILRMNYITVCRHILEAEQMSEAELVNRAKAIKPLVRLDKDGINRNFGEAKPDDTLVYIEPKDIHQSYIYTFCGEDIVTVKDEAGKTVPLPVDDLEVVTSFTCYHRHGGHPELFCPGADDVLSQIPRSVDLRQVDCFEIVQAAENIRESYDAMLERHVTTVILYKLKNGLPKEIRTQNIICRGCTCG